MSNFSDMLGFLRKRNGLSQKELAEKLGISRSTIGMYETGGREPDFETLEAIADTFNVNMDTLLGKAPSAPASEAITSLSDAFPINPTHKIPLLGCIAAGLPIFAEENIEGYLWTDHNHGGEYFGLRIRGNSMNAANIKDGDVIIVRQQDLVEDGDIAVVLIDDDATVKRFHHNGSTVILSPQSTDSSYQPQVYDMKEHSIKVLGRVVECRTAF